jgi:signal transduction histidine kinase/ActR/RegA family two-component response regulator
MFSKSFEHLRTKLLVSMLAVVFLLTAAVLALVQVRMRAHVAEDLVSTLRTESAVYSTVEEARRQQAEQSAALIANLPSLKALMSTHDPLTVQDGSESILHTSGADVLILEDPAGTLLALHSRSTKVAASSERLLLFRSAEQHDWWFVNGHLYDLSFAPITAGAGSELHTLGLVALGREVTPQSIAGTDTLQDSPVIFEREGRVLLSSLDPSLWRDFQSWLGGSAHAPRSIQEIDIGGERYLGSFIELSGDHPIRLYCLKSYDQATSFLGLLNRMLLILGAIAVLTGALVGFVLSRQITRPLEDLVQASRQMEKGDFEFPISVQGKDEVAELTRAFEQMRKSLRLSREGMLRSARLEAVGRLAGGIAHDFNNLVMIIKGYSDLLLETATPDNRPHLEEIKRAGDRASGLTRQLLAFSRKQVLEPQVLDLNHTVRGMMKMLRLLLGENIELLTSLSEQIGRVRADPGQLEQVIMNLAVNARDALPGRGKVIIETQSCNLDESYATSHNEVAPGPYVQLAVTDTGCGMNSETLTQIFEPFFTTKEPGRGTGLGLATVYGIVKQSRGHITVYSEVGVGTTFKIYLPAVDKPALSPQVQPASALPAGHGTVLLVEDEAPLRSLAAEALKRLGYEVLPAENGLEALVVADQHLGEINVVVTDIVMPRMGGPEMVEKLRRKRTGFSVIFMSGYTEAAVLENANIGKDAILLNKPFSTETLVRRMREAQEPTSPIGRTAPVPSVEL